jgi:hypothetical protein
MKLIGKKNIHYRGTLPEEMIRKELLNQKNVDEIEKAFFISEVERLQIKIEQMAYWNYKRIVLYEETIISLASFLAISILTLLLSI